MHPNSRFCIDEDDVFMKKLRHLGERRHALEMQRRKGEPDEAKERAIEHDMEELLQSRELCCALPTPRRQPVCQVCCEDEGGATGGAGGAADGGCARRKTGYEPESVEQGAAFARSATALHESDKVASLSVTVELLVREACSALKSGGATTTAAALQRRVVEEIYEAVASAAATHDDAALIRAAAPPLCNPALLRVLDEAMELGCARVLLVRTLPAAATFAPALHLHLCLLR